MQVSGGQDAEIVLRKYHGRLSIHRVDLVLILGPLGIIDGINPLLSLDHHTPILWHICDRTIARMLLTLLDRDGSIKIVAGVDLQTLLVGSDIELDARDVGGHCEDAQVGRLRRRVTRAIQDEGMIIACTAETTAIDCLRDVSSNLLRRREIQISAIDDAYNASGYFNIVELDITSSVWHVERVVQNRRVDGIGKSVQIPVNVIC